MAEPKPKMVLMLYLWCAALTVSFLGMSCYMVTSSGWRKDCKNNTADRRFEEKPNKTTSQSDPSPTPSSQNPSNCKPANKDQPGYAGRKCKFSLPIAHIVGKADSSDVEWEYSKRESILRHMQFRNGSIVIPEKGFYYVYSQVAFVGTNCSKDSLVLESKVLYKLQDYHKDHSLELMEVTQSVCESTNANPKWYRSLRQGGVFQLEENTRLFVKISPISKAEMEHHKTYFGAFKLQ
ncbi:lymphotoxin-alpha-like [Heterodontus francisci]|uniref:lymphotoxin-alpha-like n=1 Tax=Heterodontus francisci TaxID=7792 RepID=UPI00355C99A6